VNRFKIQWSPVSQRWFVMDLRDETVAADFDTLLEAEAYTIERETREEA
jgi:hypothetical protein